MQMFFKDFIKTSFRYKETYDSKAGLILHDVSVQCIKSVTK